mgnify:CR=1 FL=1
MLNIHHSLNNFPLFHSVGDIKEMIDRDFGSFDQFKSLMSAQTVAIQGSGWGWLGWNPKHGRLRLTTCANQDPVSMQGTLAMFLDYNRSHMLCLCSIIYQVLANYLPLPSNCLSTALGSQYAVKFVRDVAIR